MKAGGCLIDWHACEVFPESWIDLVVVLRVDSTTLYDRLKERYVTCCHQLAGFFSPCITALRLTGSLSNYADAKLQENLDSEIMEVLLQEAREAYDPEIVIELTSNSSDEMESNVDRIEAWVKQWISNNSS